MCPKNIPTTDIVHDISVQTKNKASLITAPQRILSETIFNGAKEIEIQHLDQIYRLRQTAQGKLILTK